MQNEPTIQTGSSACGAVWLMVVGLGFSSAITQLVLLRELLGAVQGNELILGVLLGNWLLLTGLGTGLGKLAAPLPSRSTWLWVLQIAVALVPLLQVLAVRLGRNAFFTHGATLSPLEAVAGSFIVLAPYCLASGALLTLASGLAPSRAGAGGGVGMVYSADCLGAVFGAVLFTFLLVGRLDHLAVLAVAGVANLLLATLGARQRGQRFVAVAAGGLALALATLMVWTDPDAASTARQYAPDRVLFTAHSPYGRLVVTESNGQLNVLENGVPMLASANVEQVEETVHFALAQRPAAQNVLLLAGGFSGTAREVLKYRVTNVVYVELDPALIAVGRRFLPERLADPRIRVLTTDGRRFVQQTAERFDVLIVDVPAPSTAQLNRYYTSEFFAEAKRVLVPDGVLAFALGRYENYVSDELGRLLATGCGTARQHFQQVLLLPAGKVWALASDGPLTAEIATQLERERVPTQWVRRNYLDGVLTPDRLAAVRGAGEAPAPLNTDFSPVLYYLHLRHWLSQFDARFGWGAGVLGLLAVVYLARLPAPALAVSASGFAGAALEIVLLLGVQALYGSLYQQLGLVLAVFMVGLLAGAGLGNRRTGWRQRRHLAATAFALAGWGCLLPWALIGLGQGSRAGVSPWLGQGVIALLTFGLAALVGIEFPLASRLDHGAAAGIAARLYAADFFGAWLGALLAGAVLIPLLGVKAACGLAGGLNALAGIALLARGKLQPGVP